MPVSNAGHFMKEIGKKFPLLLEMIMKQPRDSRDSGRVLWQPKEYGGTYMSGT